MITRASRASSPAKAGAKEYPGGLDDAGEEWLGQPGPAPPTPELPAAAPGGLDAGEVAGGPVDRLEPAGLLPPSPPGASLDVAEPAAGPVDPGAEPVGLPLPPEGPRLERLRAMELVASYVHEVLKEALWVDQPPRAVLDETLTRVKKDGRCFWGVDGCYTRRRTALGSMLRQWELIAGKT